MEGKIDEKGYLHIKRVVKMKKQGCPNGQGSEACGDWCPLFGEPETESDYDFDTGKYKETGRTDLSLCKKHLTFDTFVDERPKEQA